MRWYEWINATDGKSAALRTLCHHLPQLLSSASSLSSTKSGKAISLLLPVSHYESRGTLVSPENRLTYIFSSVFCYSEREGRQETEEAGRWWLVNLYLWRVSGRMKNIKPPRGEALLLVYVTARTRTKHKLPLKVKGGREAPHHVLTTTLL